MAVEGRNRCSIAVRFCQIVQQKCTSASLTGIDSFNLDIVSRLIVDRNISIAVKDLNRPATRAEDLGSDLDIAARHTNLFHDNSIFEPIENNREVLVG